MTSQSAADAAEVATTGATGITLTPQQDAALQQLIEFATTPTGPALMTLEGYAGTGKTTLVAELLRQIGPKPAPTDGQPGSAGRVLNSFRRLRVAVAAPTNKAVGVLQGKMVEAGAGADSFSSVHSLLGLQMIERDDGTHDCRPSGSSTIHEYDLVVVDECSMVGPDLFSRILASRRQARVIFVGDPAQLPPVDAQSRGEVSPTFARVNLKAVLTQVVRQAAENPIIALSMRLREAIESGHRMGTTDLLQACPEQGKPTTVGVMSGGEATAYNVALGELRAGTDCRIVAYTNAAVQGYNRDLHAALYGPDATLFAPGERVMVHEACEVRTAEAAKLGFVRAARVLLHTSEELQVISAKPEEHPFYRDVPALLLELQRDGGGVVFAFATTDPQLLDGKVSALFARVRELKQMQSAGVGTGGETVKDTMAKAWALKKAFAPLRHVYAITAHKSQGSTIDTVIVDLANLGRMRDTFEHGRALYVAATRAARHLALVA